MLKIRNVKKRDYEAVDGLLQQLQAIHMKGRPELYGPVEHCMARECFESLISNDEVIALLAELDRAVVGVCFVSLLNQSGMVKMRTAFIDQIVVDEPYRGQGIGKALFAEVTKRARAIGAKRLDLIVWSFNQPATAVYERLGMTPQRHIYEKAL